MISRALWDEAWTAALVNHLWQSTLVALLAWLLALCLRNNQAKTRYWVWMIASVKFLVPFALFIAAGEALRSAVADPVQQPTLSAIMDRVTRPFPQRASSLVFHRGAGAAQAHHHSWILLAVLAIWMSGFLVIALSWARSWLRIRAVVRAASRMAMLADVPVLSTSRLLEPGVFGVVRPVLLLPEGISGHLSAAQLNTIVAHEMCHIRRRDNLTAVLHMVVTAVFWYHPAVWWIKARLLKEREQACDEAVLESGSDAELYAESILSVCQFYLASPLDCMSGVTGADLKRRIARIMAGALVEDMTLLRKLMLFTICVSTAAVPIVSGLVASTKADAQSASAEDGPLPSFEVASIKPDHSGNTNMSIGWQPSRFNAQHTAMKSLVWDAFRVHDYQVLGAPGWLDHDRYDVDAKIDEPQQVPSDPEKESRKVSLMVQSMLIDRCKLKFHRTTKELSIYQLVVAKGGFKLQEAKPDEQFSTMNNDTQLTVKATTMPQLAEQLSAQLNRSVLDKTGLSGKYDFTLHYAPDHDEPAPGYGQGAAQPDTGPSIFSAIQDQLGLKLVAGKGPVEMIVIDHIEPPSPN